MRDLARLVVDELELRKLAAIDSLTGAMTGRAFALEAKKEVARARRYGRGLGVIMFDLDRFKQINDTFGHAAGDHVLRTTTTICEGELRGIDILGRLGGEEFAIILPEATLEGAVVTAERLREKIAEAPVDFAGQDIPVTASFGVTAYSDIDGDIANAIKRADGALYDAKGTGRNRVVVVAAPTGIIGTVAAA
jgi:diguanylate cyclase (GGDEF)-like protein